MSRRGPRVATVVAALALAACTAGREPRPVPLPTPTPSPSIGTGPFDAVWARHPAGRPFGAVVLRGLLADGTEVDTGDEVTSGPPAASNADLAPDGTAIAWDEPGGIGVWRFGTAKRHYRVPAVRVSPAPVWSPDGRTIAVGDDFGGSGQIVPGFSLVDVASGRVTHVAYRFRGGLESWSPDGRLLALRSATDRGIDVIDRAGHRVRRIGGRGWSLVTRHSWSPDGAHLLVYVQSRGALRLDVVSAATGARVPSALASGGAYVWRDPAHVARRDGETVVETALDGTATRLLLILPGRVPGTFLIRPAS
jgi:hypothetical protein